MSHLIELIRAKIEPILSPYNLNIKDILWEKMGHQKVLNITLQGNSPLDLEMISQVTNPISDALDEIKELDFEYILDIGSSGAEPFLSSIEEMTEAINDYVRVNLISQEVIEGTLLSVTQEEVTLKYFIKGRPKKSVIPLTDIKSIQRAVKL